MMKHCDTTLLKQSACDDNHKETHPSRRCTMLLRHFPYLGSAHHSTSVLVFLSFDVHPLPSSMFSFLHLRQCFSPHGLTNSVSIFSLMFTTSALALKVSDTNLIYPGIIDQQASGFEVRVSTNRYFHIQHKWRDAISDKQVNTEKQSRS